MTPPPPHPTHAALSMPLCIAQRIFVGGKDEAVEDMMFREHVEEGEITNAGLAYKPRWQEASMFQARLECSNPDREAPSQKERDPPRPSACAHTQRQPRSCKAETCVLFAVAARDGGADAAGVGLGARFSRGMPRNRDRGTRDRLTTSSATSSATVTVPSWKTSKRRTGALCCAAPPRTLRLLRA